MLAFASAVPIGRHDTLREDAPELLDAQEHLRACEEACEILKRKLQERENELLEARDLIFRLQPAHQHITHHDAVKLYGALCDGVESWVDVKFGDLFTPDSGARKNFTGRCDMKYARELLDRATPSARFFYKLRDSDEYHIRSCVMNFLLQEILGKVFYGAPYEGEIPFLDSLERSMGCLEPRRGKYIFSHYIESS
jgi:hypothetical protein